jgi:hypothetical protein
MELIGYGSYQIWSLFNLAETELIQY